MKWTGWRPERRMGIPVLGVAAAGLLAAWPGGSLSYLARQGYYEARLLGGREPVVEVLERPDVSPEVKAQLRLVQEIRKFGEAQLHMSPTQNYTTINLGWNQEIWNVSACRELAFTPYTWWFPIVGTIPYKGFFRKEEGLAERARVQAMGYETALHRVGGFSTLGWFKDPILPHMLTYPESDLASLVLHELAHATLFIPGRVDFDESFASFVGDQAALRFLEARHGRESAEYLETRARYADEERFTRFMHGLYASLDAVYSSAKPEDEKRHLKAQIRSEAAQAYTQLPFTSERYRKRRIEDMNNADLLQFRRYSTAGEQFAAVLASVDGDMSKFFLAFRTVADSGEEPFAALARLAGGVAAGPAAGPAASR